MSNLDWPAPINAFFEGKRQLSLPFDVTLSGQDYHCVKVLRLLPARRLVLLAETNDGQKVVLKCFVQTSKGKRDFKREKQGYVWVTEAGIMTPAQLAIIETTQLAVVIYQFQTHENTTEKHTQLQALLQLTAHLHQQGLYQDDIHLDNVLLANGQASLIDLASVKKAQQPLSRSLSLANLAKLIAQYSLADRSDVLAYINDYFSARAWPDIESLQQQLDTDIKHAWQKRKQDYLAKNFRNCTMTICHQDSKWQFAARRDFWQEWQPTDIAEIEQLFERAQILKAGNSATVIRTQIAGRDVVIKRYNIKNWRHALSRCWRPSRAKHSWLNANLLEFIGVPTPQALAFIEKRHGWLRSTAYFITEYIEAVELTECYRERLPTDDELRQIGELFDLLNKARIGHGDMKAQNLLVDGRGNILLIDLDAMKEYHSKSGFRTAFNKDIERFLKNWPQLPLKELFSQTIFSHLQQEKNNE